jgi:isoleucyl-tRNA synthetase
MAPVLPFTADEVWGHLPGDRGASVHLGQFPEARDAGPIEPSWPGLLDVREQVMKRLEEERAAKRIGTSLEARVTLTGPGPALAPLREYEGKSAVFPGNLANLFIVSRVDLVDDAGASGLGVGVARAEGGKCERCWTYSKNVGRQGVHAGVCERCAAVLEEL